MKFISIRKKLILQVNLILGLAFVAVLLLVSTKSVYEAKGALERNEIQIESALIAKGKLLTQNNSEALKGMVEDNAFSAIQALVSSTVMADRDILFGTFMDVDNSPWVKVTPDNPFGHVKKREFLKNHNAKWVAALEAIDFKFTEIDGYQVYLFAAPIVVDNETLGFIQYALSNSNMLTSIAAVRSESEKALVQTISLLLVLSLVMGTLGFLAVRKIAVRLSRPLNALRDAAESISGGDYEANISIESNDEIGLLANNFDTMRLTIQKKIRDLVELNALGQTLSVIETEKDIFRLALINSHNHANASFSVVYSKSDMEDQCHQSDPGCNDGGGRQWEGVIQRLMKSDGSVIGMHKVEVAGEMRAIIEVPFLAGEGTLATMYLCGYDSVLGFSDSDHEYYQSLAQMVLVSQRNIHLKLEIEQYNRNLEITIEERTTALQEKTNDISNMMLNMHQGLFTITSGGVIHPEYAKYLENIFEAEDLAGSDAMQLLFEKSTLRDIRKEQVQAVLLSLIGGDAMMFDFNRHLLVSQIDIDLERGGKKSLELDWDPIILEGNIDKMMVTVRDVTDVRALEGEAAEQKQELEIVGQILSIEVDRFENFITSAFEFINKTRTLIESNKQRSEDVINELFRYMHTIKGNARTYGFSYIADVVHIAESNYDNLRYDEAIEWRHDELFAQLEAVRLSIVQYVDISRDILKRGRRKSVRVRKGQLLVEQASIADIRSHIRSAQSEELSFGVKQKLLKARVLLDLLGTNTLEEMLEDVCLFTRSLAKELGKSEPKISIHADGFVIREGARKLFNNIFMHSLRNSLDHGIETADARTEKAKSPEGHIEIDASISGDMLEMRIHDDGQGLSLDSIKENALVNGKIKQGAVLSNQDVANLVFMPGITTTKNVTNVSGRGVGMDAVKRFVEECGGEVGINLINTFEGKDVDFTPFELWIKLPESTFVRDSIAV